MTTPERIASLQKAIAYLTQQISAAESLGNYSRARMARLELDDKRRELKTLTESTQPA